jgi:hypothetical protein
MTLPMLHTKDNAMRKILLSFTIALLLTISNQVSSYAWFDFGHMVVASVAYKRLTPQTRERANALLKLNPNYSNWEKQLPEKLPQDKKDMLIFMLAATWPDAIKTDPNYKSDGRNGGHLPQGAAASQNIGYKDKLLHKYWHFVDTPFSTDGTQLPADITPNAQTQIEAFRKAIGTSDSSDDTKSYDLTWLIHLVGDVHQPLHCATRISKIDPHGDNGGNKVAISSPGNVTNLHAIWDGSPGDSEDPMRAAKYAKQLHAADKSLAKDTNEKDWIAESFDEVKKDVYIQPIGASDGPFTLTKNYIQATNKLVKKRLELAGERLANLLNNELK